MNFLLNYAVVLCLISHQSLTKNLDSNQELTTISNNQSNNEVIKKCLKDLECGHQMNCISNTCQPMPRTSTTSSSPPTHHVQFAETEPDHEITTSNPKLPATLKPSPPHDSPDDMDFGSVPTTVWLSFAIPFISIMLFLVISGYIYRRIDKNRSHLDRHHNNFYGNRPAIIDNLYEEGQRTFDSRINQPPPSYDKVILEMTELPPSYESLQNIPKN